MPLAKDSVAILFSEGVDTKTDAKQVVVGKLLDLQNCIFTKEATLSKRNGYLALSQQVDAQALPYKNAQGLARRGSELVLFANALAYSYRPSSGTWQQSQPVSSVVAQSLPMARTGTKQTMPDVATNAGVSVVAWEDNRGGVWCSVLEAGTNRILLAQVQLDALGQRPRCLPVGGVLHVIWTSVVAGNNVIQGAIVNPSSPGSTPLQFTLTTDVNSANPAFDAVPTYNLVTSSAPALVAWVTSGTTYRVGYLHSSGVWGGPATGLPSPSNPVAATDTTGPIACAINVNKVSTALDACVIWAGAGVLRQQFWNPTTLAPGAISTIDATGSVRNHIALEYGGIDPVNGGYFVWWAADSPTGGDPVVTYAQLNGLGAVGPLTVIHGHTLASRAYNDNGNVYCAVVYPVLFFPYVGVIQLSGSGRVQARLLAGLSAGTVSRPHLPNAIATNLVTNASGSTSTGRQHQMCLGYRIQLSGTSGTQFGEQGIQLVTLDHNHSDSYQSTELGRSLYLAGAVIQNYDGDRWAEADFHTAPDTPNGGLVLGQAAGGGLTALATYSYVAIYEEINGQGELVASAPSVLSKITLAGGGANQTVTITLPMLRLTSKRRVRVSVFRSLANATGTAATIPLYRVSSVDPTAVGNNGYVLNNPTVDGVTFTDVMTDAVAATLEPLYTNGGILPNAPPLMAGDVIVGGKNRLFWTDPTDRHRVLFSQQLRQDTAAELAASLAVQVDPFGGPITGLAIMDDNVIVFKQTAIYAFGGPGPQADGGLQSNSAFTPAQLLTSDVGTSSPSSIASTPIGVVFASAKGIYILGRDLHVRRIGDDVYAYKDQNITRATLVADRPHVIFLTNQQRTLLWDYDRDKWSTFTNHLGLDATTINGVYTYLRTDGRVFQETLGQYSDGGAHIPMLIETAWVKLTGKMQAWQKVWHALILGAWKSRHTLRMRYRIDYEDAYSTPFDLPVNAVYMPGPFGGGQYGGLGDGAYGGQVGVSSLVLQEEVDLNRRCQAISFRFEDIEALADFGASFELSELLLTGGVAGPEFRPGANRQN